MSLCTVKLKHPSKVTISKTQFLSRGRLCLTEIKWLIYKHNKSIGQCSITVPPQSLTFAPLASCLVQGIAVEAPPAVLAVVALCVPQAFQTSPTDGVTYSQRVEVHVAVAVASHTRSSHPRLSQGVAIVTVFTHLTARPYTKVKEVGRN